MSGSGSPLSHSAARCSSDSSSMVAAAAQAAGGGGERIEPPPGGAGANQHCAPSRQQQHAVPGEGPAARAHLGAARGPPCVRAPSERSAQRATPAHGTWCSRWALPLRGWPGVRQRCMSAPGTGGGPGPPWRGALSPGFSAPRALGSGLACVRVRAMQPCRRFSSHMLRIRLGRPWARNLRGHVLPGQDDDKARSRNFYVASTWRWRVAGTSGHGAAEERPRATACKTGTLLIHEAHSID